MKANLEHKKFAGDLQLQRFKEAVTPDMLKKADISAEDWERFLQNYRDYLKRLDGDLKDLEKLDPKDKVTLLPQGGVRRLDAVRGTPAEPAERRPVPAAAAVSQRLPGLHPRAVEDEAEAGEVAEPFSRDPQGSVGRINS